MRMPRFTAEESVYKSNTTYTTRRVTTNLTTMVEPARVVSRDPVYITDTSYSGWAQVAAGGTAGAILGGLEGGPIGAALGAVAGAVSGAIGCLLDSNCHF